MTILTDTVSACSENFVAPSQGIEAYILRSDIEFSNTYPLSNPAPGIVASVLLDLKLLGDLGLVFVYLHSLKKHSHAITGCHSSGSICLVRLVESTSRSLASFLVAVFLDFGAALFVIAFFGAEVFTVGLSYFFGL